MLKHIISLGLVSALLLATGYADQSRKIVIPVKRTDPTSGQQMYSSYCAPCHGTDGRGNGQIAGELKTRPTDLTALARNHNGKFPEQHVLAVLRFGTESHSGQMPAWGRVLGNMSNVYQQQERDLRASNLTRYLQSIQVK
jgi:mono/diheme cytochrome c family protein